MINKEIFDHCINNLCGMHIYDNARKNGETPFGYVIDYIKDMFGVAKADGWDTAQEVCDFFGFKEWN